MYSTLICKLCCLSGSVPNHQTTESFLHGCGWSGTQSEDEPTEREKIQVQCNTYQNDEGEWLEWFSLSIGIANPMFQVESPGVFAKVKG